MIQNVILNERPKFKNTEHVFINKDVQAKLEKYGLTFETEKMTCEKLEENLEIYLLEETKNNNSHAYFQLGQLYYYKEDYENSLNYFKEGAEKFEDIQCMFQLGVQYYDGLGYPVDPELGCSYMKAIINLNSSLSHITFAAAYNLGRAYFEGFGLKQSDTEAEKFWLLAADDGNPLASVMAQTALGFFYSTKDHFDLAKSFFWHSEACGNGSVESQGALGVMYLYGLGVAIDWEASLICLSNAAERGSVYAKGNLCYYFYRRKLFTKASDLSAKLSQLTEDELLEMSRANSIVILDYLHKGVAIACFIFGRCLQCGLGVQKDCGLAVKYFRKCMEFDLDLCADFHKMVENNTL